MILRPITLAATALACLGAAVAGTEMAHRSTVYAPHGIIATSQPLATAAGLAVLERGGNAIDAAVTAAAVLNVTEPMMTGIGGDMFAIVWSVKDHKLYGLNASGRAGSLMTREALLARGHKTMPGESVEDVTVPGTHYSTGSARSRSRRRSRPPSDTPRRDSRSRRSSRRIGKARRRGSRETTAPRPRSWSTGHTPLAPANGSGTPISPAPSG